MYIVRTSFQEAESSCSCAWLRDMASFMVVKKEFSSPLFNQLTVSAGETLSVDWDKWVLPDRVDQGFVPINHLTPNMKNIPDKLPGIFITKDEDNEVVKFKDVLFPPETNENKKAEEGGIFSSSLFSFSTFMNTHPPVLEPGLDSFIWPMSKEEFLDTIWAKKAYAVLGASDRLIDLKKHLFDFDTLKLIEIATTAVVWMKTKTGEMQHFSADNAVARQCYLAGHSLNFNLPAHIQKMYIKDLAQDMGFDFGLEREGAFGGDVEMFACIGKNVTNWHFDGQDNFTIQLRGTKRWSVLPGVPCPLTNCNIIHPDSTAYGTYTAQKKCHTSYCDMPLPPDVDPSQVRTFVLRPGSILYFPSGYWHHVVCDDEEGSLSINFAMYPSTWLDLLKDAMVQHLWKFRHWREAIVVKSADLARKQLQAMLEALPQEIGKITAEDMLPESLFLSQRKRKVEVCTERDQNSHVDIDMETKFAKNPIALLFKDDEAERRWITVERQRERERQDSQRKVTKQLKKEARGEEYHQKEQQPQQNGLEADNKRKREDDVDAPFTKVSYSLNMGFGNKELQSTLEIKLLVERRMTPVVDWIQKREEGVFSAKEVFEYAMSQGIESRKHAKRRKKQRRQQQQEQEQEKEKETAKGKEKSTEDEGEEDSRVSFEEVKQVLRVLSFNGYIRTLHSA